VWIGSEEDDRSDRKGRNYVLECLENREIAVPKPKEASSSKLAEGFKVPSGTSVTFIAECGTLPVFENEGNGHSRLFTFAKGGSLTLQGITLSATTTGPRGVSAGKVNDHAAEAGQAWQKG